jgi:hypothetical protein
MRRKEPIRLSTILSLAIVFIAGSTAAAQIVQQNRNPYYLLPDLAFTKVIKKSESTIIVAVSNLGKVKSPSAEGSYGCESIKPDENGIKIGFSSLLAIKSLAPGAWYRFSFSCGDGIRVTGASLDNKKQVKESNENNNTITF